MIEPVWLTAEAVIQANMRMVAKTGEPFQVRDAGLVESAVAKPRNRYLYDGETDVAELATTLLLGIARNHPFVQGNKRAAFASAVMFLELNGWQLSDSADGWLYLEIDAVIKGELDEAEFAGSLRRSLTAIWE